jgi:hypothetical protein
MMRMLDMNFDLDKVLEWFVATKFSSNFYYNVNLRHWCRCVFLQYLVSMECHHLIFIFIVMVKMIMVVRNKCKGWELKDFLEGIKCF